MLELYFKYRRVMARFRRGALGNEIDHIAAGLSRAGYARGSAKLYLARIARFSAYATGCGCSNSAPVPAQVVDRYLTTRRTVAERWGHKERSATQRGAFRSGLRQGRYLRTPMVRCWLPTCGICALSVVCSQRPARGSC